MLNSFYDDLDDSMLDPEFAYEFGRQERELEIVQLVQRIERHSTHSELCYKEHRFVERLIAAIKGDNK
jgi:hypothetical protein